MNWSKLAIGAALLASLALAGCASPPPAVNTDVVINFPPEDPVTSVDQADHALQVAQLARQQIGWRYQMKEQACYDRFFMNSCLLDAKNERRADLARVKKVEVAANFFKRRQQVEDMDRNLYQRNEANPLPDAAPASDDAVSPADNEEQPSRADDKDRVMEKDSKDSKDSKEATLQP